MRITSLKMITDREINGLCLRAEVAQLFEGSPHGLKKVGMGIINIASAVVVLFMPSNSIFFLGKKFCDFCRQIFFPPPAEAKKF